MSTPSTSGNNTSAILSPDQLARLRKIIQTGIHSDDGQLLMRVHMGELLMELINNFSDRALPIRRAFLVGGAASHIINEEYGYTDSDLELEIDPGYPTSRREERNIFDGIREAIFDMLRKKMEKAKFNMEDSGLIEKFIAKKVLIHNETEAWSLFSFHHVNKANLEIKSVLRMGRKYQFASDSLRIDLTPLLGDFGDFHVSSSYGTVQEVTDILRDKIIKTKQPENIHGGGLLKYCLLKAKGFKDNESKLLSKKLRKAMADGFLRTFEKGTTTKFLQNHFKGDQFYVHREQFLMELTNFRDRLKQHLEIIKEEVMLFNPNY
ncbi:hypothetical protein CAEBREN_08497 [Caenorhabditis brenneri]|uniref:polynucleotide adenylyltransferase n=1 Tax=Caenorhabditis brenneri TaxID=135651 RepID=G0MYK7_CAEBE|nr:hypothetical protein CAEBREN_08497 [Caenorhabditis brenneri]